MKQVAVIMSVFGGAGLVLSLRTDPPGTPIYVLDAITGSAGTPWMLGLLGVAAFLGVAEIWAESAHRQRAEKQT